ncbi:hypothetical protein [Flavobacterium aquicola]|uniref:hypothetical protein n=1 Tax=Flavobacterium aquicola TaxID=1682742 RepID=UPI0011C0786E|nr:hypothetical protein [Flavobacterium aquicola]
MIIYSAVALPLTFWYYSGFGTKLSPFFGFAKSSKYKTIFPLSQLPKSVVVAVTGWLLPTDIPIIDRFQALSWPIKT